MSNPRAAIIRAAFKAAAEELIALGSAKSGHCLIHFQSGLPMTVEWRLLARPVARRFEQDNLAEPAILTEDP